MFTTVDSVDFSRCGLMKGMARSLLLAAGLLFASSPGAYACPNCKEAVSASEGQVASMSSGYNWSVLFMLAVPFSMLGTGAFMVRRAVKRGVFPEM
jgi:hypothetical protein